MRLCGDFASKLLRMHTLEAISCQLAAAARPLSTQRERRRAVVVLKQARALLTAVQHNSWAWDGRTLYSRQLQTAVRRSGILEHAARLVIRLLEAVATGASDASGTDSSSPDSDIATQAVSHFLAMHDVTSFLHLGGTGPCADHVALVLGLALLCAMDGGPAYGLPEELLDAVTPAALATALRASVPGDSPSGEYAGDWLHTTLHQLQYAADVRAGSGIAGWRAALDVLLRLARLGLAAIQEQQQQRATAGETGGSGLAGDQQQQRQRGPAAEVWRAASEPYRPPGPQLSARRGYVLAADSLKYLKRLLRPRSPLGRAQAAECWRLAMELTTEQMLRSGPSAFTPRSVLAASFDPIADLHTPAEPPPDVAVPLAAGLLPCLERLFRRAGEELTARRWLSALADPPGTDHAELLKDLFRRMGPPLDSGWRYLAPLLAHGEPRQAAALVVTLGKVLRHVVAGLQGCEAMDSLEACFVLLAADVLLAGKEAGLASAAAAGATAVEDGGGSSGGGGSGGGGGGGGGGGAGGATAVEDGGFGGCSPAATQLRGMLLLAAREWLPSLVAVLCSRRLGLCEDVKYEHKLVLPLAVAGWLTLAASACAGSCGAGDVGPAAALPGGSTAVSSNTGSTGSSITGSSGLGHGSSASDSGDSPGGGGGGTGGGEDGAEGGDAVEGSGRDRGSVGGGGGTSQLGQSLLASIDRWAALDAVLRTLIPHLLNRLAGDLAVSAAAEACVVLAATFPEGLRVATVTAVIQGALRQPGRRERGPVAPLDLSDLVDTASHAGQRKELVAALEALAEQLLRWQSCSEDMPPALLSQLGKVARPLVPRYRRVGALLAAAAAAPGPSALRSLVPCCANPGCTSLQGDSEAGVRLQACGRCGGVGYCCRECQTAHWRAGHKAECVDRRAEKGGGAGR